MYVVTVKRLCRLLIGVSRTVADVEKDLKIMIGGVDMNVTLNEFVNAWFGKSIPLLVYADYLLCEVLDYIDKGTKWEDIPVSAEFCLYLECTDYTVGYYLKEKFSESIVKHFCITPQGLIVFIMEGDE